MNTKHTTLAVQGYLNELGDRSSSEPLIRALLDRAVRRLHCLCAAALFRRYPRLTRPPLNLQAEELLGAVVERLIKALRGVRPATTREFFGLVSRHIRWELNEMARRFDERPALAELPDELAWAPEASAGSQSASGPTADARRILAAVEALPEPEREAFDLVRVQGMSQAEAGEVLGVSAATVNRRLHRGLQKLEEALADLYPDDDDTDSDASDAQPEDGGTA